jgi:hypothetical protein
VFVIGEEGIAQVEQLVDSATESDLVRVAKNCPSHAISVTIDGQLVAGGQWLLDGDT